MELQIIKYLILRLRWFEVSPDYHLAVRNVGESYSILYIDQIPAHQSSSKDNSGL